VAREFGLEPSQVIKLASNENPQGCSARVIAAIAQSAPKSNLYPDFYTYDLQHAIAAHVGVTASQVLTGAGSSELIVLAAQAYLDTQRAALFPQYSFHSYRSAVQAVGGEAIVVPVRDWHPDFDAMLAALTARTHVVYLASPNNPTGISADPVELERFVEVLPEHILLVLDEAYREYVAPEKRLDTLRLLARRRNLLIMRTFSKIHGLAGLRVGYGLGDPTVLQTLRLLQAPFSVNSVAQVAACAALGDPSFALESYRFNLAERQRMAHEFAARQIEQLPSQGNFILARVGDGERVATDLRRQGVIVRPVNNYGLREWVRVTVGLPEQNDAFFAKLDPILARVASSSPAGSV
jgi:histidinol-phosphate aminotransferase